MTTERFLLEVKGVRIREDVKSGTKIQDGEAGGRSERDRHETSDEIARMKSWKQEKVGDAGTRVGWSEYTNKGGKMREKPRTETPSRPAQTPNTTSSTTDGVFLFLLMLRFLLHHLIVESTTVERGDQWLKRKE